MIKDNARDIVNYYKGKDIKEADKLLLKTAQNNFKAGQEAERKKILDVLKDMWILDYVTKDRCFLSGKFFKDFEKALKKEVEKK